METLQTRGIRPQKPYDLGSPWGDNRVASTDELVGRMISITRDDGAVLELAFDSDTVRWSTPGSGAEGSAPYDAVAIREQIYFIQYMHEDQVATTSLALNLRLNCGVFATNTLVRGDNRADLQQDLYACVITGSDGELPQLTTELVGKRAYAEYADGHAVEHLYFNPRRIVWQGLGRFEYSGSECDNATTWKLDEKLYLLSWVEDAQAVGAILLLDYEAMRNVGILFGLDDNGFLHTLVGARLELLDELTYPAGYEPSGTVGDT